MGQSHQRSWTSGAVLVFAVALGVGCDESGAADMRDVVLPAAGSGAPQVGAPPAVGTPGGTLDPTAPPVGNQATQPGGAPDDGAQAVAGTPVPCDVQQVVATNCQQCHGATPVGGAIRLVTHEDWHQVSPVYAAAQLGSPGMLVHEVARVRIGDGSMPQGATMQPDQLALLDGWLAAGALAGGPQDEACAPAMLPDDGSVGAPEPRGEVINSCERPGAYDPPAAAPELGETCYDFRVAAPGGAGKFTIQPGESYHEWYYDVPWAPGSQLAAYGGDFDNLQVLHHYLIFTNSAAGKVPGQLDQNVTGTTLGSNSTLIGGWAVGGCTYDLPDDIGLELEPSPLIMVQWHMYNSTGSPQQDGSAVRVCTVPPGTRPNTASITFLGTENFNGPLGMPPGESSFVSNCTNNSGQDITLLGFSPHMHVIGKHMKAELFRSDGSSTLLLDEPFQFDYQVGYEITPTVMKPGDRVQSTCSFFNDTGANVAFGQSTNQEMCYNYVFSYPAGALDNGVPSLIGATNTCW